MDKVEEIREKLHIAIFKYGLNSKQTKSASKTFDEVMNKYYTKERKYEKDNIMYDTYQKSLEHLSEITSDFIKFPSVEEWNKYAKEKNLLSSESIKYISGLNWHRLRNRVKS